MKDKIGFIGLGAMGGRMVPHLLKAGWEVFVADTNTEAVAEMVRQGAARCEGPSHVADNANIVLVCLPTPAIVEEVVLGLGGVAQGTRVKIVVDHSTSGIVTARRLATELASRHIESVDAPLAGGVAGAAAGTLSVMAAGSSEAWRRCEPVFRAFGKNLAHVGRQPGLGQALKLVNNSIVASTLVATAEAMLMGVKAGLDPEQLLAMLNVSTARSFTTEHMVPQAVMNRKFDFGFRMDLLRKDMRLFLAEAEALGTPAATLAAAKQVYDQALGAVPEPTRDMTRVVEFLEGLGHARIAPR